MKALVIFSIAVSILFLLQILVCILIGMRKGHVKALFGLGANLIAAVAAILTAKVIAIYGSTVLQHKITDLMVSKFEHSGGTDFLKGDGMTEIIRSVSNTLVALAVFFLLYLLFYFLIKIPRNMVYNRYGSRWEDNRLKRGTSKACGALICVLSGVFSAVLLVMPFTAILSSVEDGIKDSRNTYAMKLEQELSPILKSPFHIAAEHSGAVSLFNFLTSVDYKDNDVVLTTECSDILYIALASSAYTTDRDLSKEEETALLEDIKSRLERSVFMPQLASDFIGGVTTEFSKGQKFLGISPLLPGGHFKSVFQDLYKILAKTTADNVRSDIPMLLSISSTLYHAATSDGDNAKNLLTTLTTDDTLSDFLGDLYSNEDLRNLIPKFVIAGIETTCDTLGLDPGTYKMLDSISDTITMDAIVKEARLISDLVTDFNRIEDTNGSISLSTMNKEQCSQVAGLLQDSKNSIFLKEIIPNLVKNLLKDTFSSKASDLMDKLSLQTKDENAKVLAQYYTVGKLTAKDPVLFKKEIENIATLYGINSDSVFQ